MEATTRARVAGELRAQAGDRLIIRRHHVGEPDRAGETLEVQGEGGRPPSIVRWSDDGRVGYILPGSDAFAQHVEHDHDS